MSTEEQTANPNTNGFTLVIEDGTKTNGQILFFAISGLITFIFCTIFAWILMGYITQNRNRLSTPLILATMGVITFAWIDAFITFIFKTNVFVSDAKYVMNYGCSQSLHFTALSYGIYRYSLYIFYLIRIRHFFKGTAHEFRKQKFIATFTLITLTSFCLICVLIFYQTPTIITTNKYVICSGELNDELREEILIFLIMDVFVSLYLTWLFVIKSRALLALENANKNALNDEEEYEEDYFSNEEEASLTNGNINYGIDNANMPRTYFIDELNGGLKAVSVRVLMLRCIYFGMLAMMVTWVHLALRFINNINMQCLETLINSLCIVLSFDVAQNGYAQLFCWFYENMGDRHGYGRNVRKKRRSSQIEQHEQKERELEYENGLSTVDN